MCIKLSPLAMSIGLALFASHMATAAETETDSAELESITVTASADASAEGLSPAFAGGQVAEGGRAGILGTKDNLDTPFSITSYTNEFIQDRHARSVGEVLQNDPTVRVARGFGNFQESYFIRGFITTSDDIAYNGLYSLLPRQYIATELFERVELLRGASSFLTGANPNGGGIGGAINLLPKRAPNYDLNRVTVGLDSGSQANVSADVARRFGEDDEFGVRVNVAHRNGGTAVEDEEAELSLFNVGLDWQGEKLRLSADLGFQDHQLDETRPNVRLVGNGINKIPSAPNASKNWAQDWSYSNEQNYFGTFRAEYDLRENVTAWAAYGMRRGDESNFLANLNVNNPNTGAGSFSRFDNDREDRVDTGEVGVRGNFETGAIGHDWVIAYSYFKSERKNAFGIGSALTGNLYNPVYYSRPALSELPDTALANRTKLNSFAIGDTLAFYDERFLLTLGARYQSLKVEDFAYFTTGDRTRNYEDNKVTPAVGAVFKLTDNTSIYANYIESLSTGDDAPQTANTSAGNDIDLVNAGESLAPYVSEQAEVGIKYETEKFGLGLAYFTTDKPRGVVDKTDPTAPVFKESGEDQHQGVELTMYGMATDDLKLLGGITWLDTEQQDTGDANIDGNRVIGVAEWQATIGAEWEIPTVAGLAVDGRVNYTGSRYADDTNTLKVDDWTTMDIGARYLMQLGNQDLTLRARVHNIFDRDYWSSVGGFPGNGYLVLGAPRTVTLSATMDF
jgi:iron complex outermembrane receptor protein